MPKSRLEKSLSCVCKNNNNSNSCNYCYSGGYNNSCSNISTNSSIKRDDNRSTNSTERVQESTELCDFCSQNRVPVVVVSSGQALHQRYDINNDNVDSFVANGVLEPLLEESFLIYAQVDELLGKKQVGIFAAIDVQDCQESVIKRHEQTTRKGDVSSENSHSYDVSNSVLYCRIH